MTEEVDRMVAPEDDPVTPAPDEGEDATPEDGDPDAVPEVPAADPTDVPDDQGDAGAPEPEGGHDGEDTED